MPSHPHMGPGHRWHLAPLGGELPGPASLHPVVRQVLARRGLTGDDALAYLRADVGNDDPFRLAGMSEAVDRLRRALRDNELIAVYGDFDVDGVSATAVILEALWALGGRAKPFLPHRERDGYGVHAGALKILADAGVSVVVTVDCGIRDAAALATAADGGLDVIVTDHHALPSELPRAAAVINPHRPDCAYGYTHLAGVGLAYKLAQALMDGAPAGPLPRVGLDSMLDLVALGTVADVVPLVGENRALVRRGLATMRGVRRPGLAELMAAAEVQPDTVTAEDVAWSLAPRLNAAGRLDHALPALELLLTRDSARARTLARELTARNRQRQAYTRTALDEAEAVLAGQSLPYFVVHTSESAPLGVLGLVAGRLCERLYRPVAAVRVDGDVARGSIRSIAELNAADVLEEVSDLLVRYGGHARAAGFSLRSADLPALIERLDQQAALRLAEVDLRPELAIDAEVHAAGLDWSLHNALEELAPFGEGNRRPLLVVRGAHASEPKIVGESHLSFQMAGTGDPVRAIAFRQGAKLEEVSSQPVDIVATLESDRWKGTARLELKVKDLAPEALGLGLSN